MTGILLVCVFGIVFYAGRAVATDMGMEATRKACASGVAGCIIIVIMHWIVEIVKLI